MGEDHRLLEGVLNSDRLGKANAEVFAKLVRKYYRPLHRLCTRLMGCPHKAEDIVQESLIKSYRSLGTLRNFGSYKSWLYRIAINTARNELRLKREVPMEIEDHLLNPTSGADIALSNRSIAKVLRRFVEELPKKQKQALCLRIYDDLSFREIAQIMSCPYDTAKANYRHAVVRMREMLREEAFSREDLRVRSKLGGILNFKTGVEG
jgi:RNA polymerase sigma-70 factor (ECF subfamily)